MESVEDAVLVLGGRGMLASALVEECRRRGRSFVAPGRRELDVRDDAAVDAALERHRPSLVVNCAAFTRVDDCEELRDAAFAVNGTAVDRLARAVRDRSALMMHVSTDYVFDGQADRPYDEEAPTAPINAYGASKLAGEQGALAAGALVVRTSWLFGVDGPNFVAAMLARARAGEPLRVVDDQVGCPTYTLFLARALLDLAATVTEARKDGGDPPLLFHYRNEEPVSWYQFALAILEQWRLDVEIEPVPTTEFPRPALRPGYSVLGIDRFERFVGRPVESWRDGLSDYHRRESDGRDAE